MKPNPTRYTPSNQANPRKNHFRMVYTGSTTLDSVPTEGGNVTLRVALGLLPTRYSIEGLVALPLGADNQMYSWETALPMQYQLAPSILLRKTNGVITVIYTGSVRRDQIVDALLCSWLKEVSAGHDTVYAAVTIN